jgi:hypothetical protein
MSRLISAAVATKPDGLIVSIPNATCCAARRWCHCRLSQSLSDTPIAKICRLRSPYPPSRSWHSSSHQEAALPFSQSQRRLLRIDFRAENKGRSHNSPQILSGFGQPIASSCIRGCSDPTRQHNPKPAKGAICLSLASCSTGASSCAQLETCRSAGREKNWYL